MEAVSPIMELATSYITTPYGVAAMCGIILVSVLLLVFSTQKELSYEDYNRQQYESARLLTAKSSTAAPKKIKKTFKRKSKKSKDSPEGEEEETQYDIVKKEDVPLAAPAPAPEQQEDDVAEIILPSQEVIVPKKKSKKKKQKREDSSDDAAVIPTVSSDNMKQTQQEPERVSTPNSESLLRDAMEPVVEVAEVPVVAVETVLKTQQSPPNPPAPAIPAPKTSPPNDKKTKKPKKKPATYKDNNGGVEGIFQIVDQADLSEDEIETLLAILKSKEGDDNWLAAGRQADETKDGLRRKISMLENCITDLKRDVDVLQQNSIAHSEEKKRITVELRNQEKVFLKEKENLSNQLIKYQSHTQDEVVRLQKEIEERDKLNSSLQLQITRSPVVQQCAELESKVVELEEELQESRDQYNDLERNISKINVMEKKLLERDNTISVQKSQIQQLEQEVSAAQTHEDALNDAQSQAKSLRSELEKLQNYVSDFEKLRAENDTLKSEINLLKDTTIPDKIAAAAKSDKVEVEQPVKSADTEQLYKKSEEKVKTLTTEVTALKEKIAELEKSPSESSSTVDVSAEIAEQLQVAESQLSAVKKDYDQIKTTLSKVERNRDTLALEVEKLKSEVKESKSTLVEVDSEKLEQAVKERDSARAEAKKFQKVVSKTEAILSQLQVKFESDIQRWALDLEEKRRDLEQERSRVSELEQKLASNGAARQKLAEYENEISDLRNKLSQTENQLTSEKRWHSETLVKLKETEDSASNQTAAHDVESANADVSILQDKLAAKNAEMAELISENEELKHKIDEFASGNNTLQDQVNSLREKQEESEMTKLRYELIELNKRVRETNAQNEYLKYRLGQQQSGEKKVTPI